MTTKRPPKTQHIPDAQLLGARLRQARLDSALSLQEVETLTQGAVKAATLSTYELGDTNIPAVRLLPLAELYAVSVDELLSSSGSEGPSRPTEEPVHAVGQLVRIDLTQLEKAKGRDVELVAQLVESIRVRRSASSGRYFAMRSDDLIAAAAVIGHELDEILVSLQTAGVLRRPRGRPLGRRK
ncbi:MAG: helix-turn-helix transcriptional regulator [Acidimicrobiales bacterium]|jgi:transcriptional regulator with XRE-family HTH domain